MHIYIYVYFVQHKAPWPRARSLQPTPACAAAASGRCCCAAAASGRRGAAA